MKKFMIKRNFGDEECKYNLFGVVLHTGTLNGGHYTALAKNQGHWYEFNDTQVI